MKEAVAARRTYFLICTAAAGCALSQSRLAMTIALCAHVLIWVTVLVELTKDVNYNKEARMKK